MANIIHSNKKNEVPMPENNKGSNFFSIVLFVLAGICVFAYIFTGSPVAIILGICIALCFLLSVLLSGIKVESSTPPEKVFGNMGEKKAEIVFEKYLNDEYTVIQNIELTFNNERCEIDNLVISKTGIFIVEVKSLKGTIIGDCNEKFWQQIKTDQYIDENKNPVMQVSRQIRILKNYLKANKISTYINGAVYFTEEDMVLSLIGEPKKDIHLFKFNETEKLISYIENGKANISPNIINRIIVLLT